MKKMNKGMLNIQKPPYEQRCVISNIAGLRPDAKSGGSGKLYPELSLLFGAGRDEALVGYTVLDCTIPS